MTIETTIAANLPCPKCNKAKSGQHSIKGSLWFSKDKRWIQNNEDQCNPKWEIINNEQNNSMAYEMVK